MTHLTFYPSPTLHKPLQRALTLLSTSFPDHFHFTIASHPASANVQVRLGGIDSTAQPHKPFQLLTHTQRCFDHQLYTFHTIILDALTPWRTRFWHFNRPDPVPVLAQAISQTLSIPHPKSFPPTELEREAILFKLNEK